MSRALSTLAIASITGRHTPIVSVYGLAGAAFGFTIDWFSHSYAARVLIGSLPEYLFLVFSDSNLPKCSSCHQSNRTIAREC